MEIIKVTNNQYHQFIVQSQISMALETEDFQLDERTVSSGVSAVINDPLKGHYYVCTDQGKPVACLLTVPEWSDWRSKTVLWIHSVYVTEEYRQKGIYKSMYEYLKQMVSSDDNYAGLRLYVDKTNKRAIEVYHKLGMQSDHYALCEWMK